jgi:hypothetical protein
MLKDLSKNFIDLSTSPILIFEHSFVTFSVEPIDWQLDKYSVQLSHPSLFWKYTKEYRPS